MGIRNWAFGIGAGIIAVVGVGCDPRPDATVKVETPAPVLCGIRFAEVGEDAGLRYTWQAASGARPLNILQTVGNGCAFLDYDRDGNLDILLVGQPAALYRGDGKGKFTDVSVSSGIGNLKGHFLGCAVGDYDNDGFPDVYLSAYRGGALLHNEGGKRFADMTRTAGIAPQPWGTAAAWVETVPGSGRLDLVIGNYCKFGPGTGERELCSMRTTAGTYAETSCPPRSYTPIKAALFRNQGNGKFTDITVASGINKGMGRTLGIAACDFDNSGQQAISFANDEIAGDLMVWQKGKYANLAEEAGTAYDAAGNVHGGMGTDWGDYDNDGAPDLIVATFSGEPKSLYRNESGVFRDIANSIGLGGAALPYVAFGCKFLDGDNDGWLDLTFASGHVQDNITLFEEGATYRQTMQFFRNNRGDGGGRPRYEDISKSVGAAFQTPLIGRGLATGDYDNDGRVDILVVDSGGKPLLLHNDSSNTGYWLHVRLVGKKSNRDGYGAIVTAIAGERRLRRDCRADGSYLSSSDPRVHFGLGAMDRVNQIEVRWPSGRRETFVPSGIDQEVTLEEGKGKMQ